MFNWLRKQNRFQQSPSENISELHTQKLIHQIQGLVGVTQADFRSLYIKTIQRFSEFLAIPNQAADESPLFETLNDVVLSLRKRRGYLLPLGTDSETSFREQEEWTFAVFAASLLNHIDIKSRFDIAEAILPGQAFAWLHRNKYLFALWKDYLQGDEKYNIFKQIVVQSKTSHPLEQIGTNKHSTVKKSEALIPIAEIQKTPKPSSQKSKPVSPKNYAIQKVDSTPLPNKKDEQSLPVFQAVDFWQWLKEAITYQQIETNHANSMVHGVEDGVFVCIPGAIDTFLYGKVKKHAINSDQVILDQRITLTKAVKKHGALIRNVQGSLVHSYCIGKWENRNVLSGIIIKTEVLLGKSKILPINSALSVDPIDNG